MSRLNLPNVVVGNDFIVVRPKLQVAAPAVAPAAITVAPAAKSVQIATPVLDDLEIEFEKMPHKSIFGRILEFLHKYSLGTFALLFLAVSASAVIVGGSYWANRMEITLPAAKHALTQPTHGPNTRVKTSDLDVMMQSLTSQPISLAIDGKNVAVSADTIRSWIQTVSGKGGVTYLHVNQDAITKSLNDAAKPSIKAPVNQVTAIDGSQTVIATGRNGTKLGDITPIANQITDSLIQAKGMQFTLPTETQAFAVVPASSIDKLIEVNVDTKQMWLYDKGVLYKQFPISAGAPATPTPIGQFNVYSKFAVQDMRGYNADGSKYFQPHVRWINYFLPGGYAVHGNYWRPQSWFGAVNSSHGCVSLPDDQAKVVYDWAPIGTTVITHH